MMLTVSDLEDWRRDATCPDCSPLYWNEKLSARLQLPTDANSGVRPSAAIWQYPGHAYVAVVFYISIIPQVAKKVKIGSSALRMANRLAPRGRVGGDAQPPAAGGSVNQPTYRPAGNA